MASYTKIIGDIGVSMVVTEFSKHRINVLLPYDDNSPYDIVIYVNNEFFKIQVKTTEQIVDNCMIFKTCKNDPYNKKVTLYTKDEVDYFAFYCIENEWCGLMSYEDYCSKETRIRTKLPNNNQIEKSKLMVDYNFHDKILDIFGKDLISNNIIHKIRKRYKKTYKKKICPICNINEIRITNSICRECYLKEIKKVKEK